MPQLFKIGRYIIYFWMNENIPLEPIHIHVSLGKLKANSTKIWITSDGGCILCNNNSKIPKRTLKNITELIALKSDEIIKAWKKIFGEVRFYC